MVHSAKLDKLWETLFWKHRVVYAFPKVDKLQSIGKRQLTFRNKLLCL